jgi:hypothetical protein
VRGIVTLETEGALAMSRRTLGISRHHGDKRRGPHATVEKPDHADEASLRDQSEEAEVNSEARGCGSTALDMVNRKIGVSAGLRPLATLHSAVRVPRGLPVPPDRERLLPHGPHRVRIVKLPRCLSSTTVPEHMPTYAISGAHGSRMPKKRGQGGEPRPESLPRTENRP